MVNKTLVIVEYQTSQMDEKSLVADSLKSIAAASQLEGDIHALVIGYQVSEIASEVSSISAVKQVLVADNQEYEHQLAENSAKLVAEIAADYTHIIAPATTFGKDLLPRVAALLDVGMLSDVIEIESDDTVVRPIYAGNALARVQSHDKIKVMTIRGSAFDSAEMGDSSIAPVVELTRVIENPLSEFISNEINSSERPDLTSANIVISGGRGLGSKEGFVLLEKLADKLNGAIGASRAAVDAGFVPNDLQVGQTGKIVAPDLYIAVGISGAIQHVAGMKDSKAIVAINSDPNAPIFEIADYGLVGDLFEILPELTDLV